MIDELEYPTFKGSEKLINMQPFVENNLKKFDKHEKKIQEILKKYNKENTLFVSKDSSGATIYKATSDDNKTSILTIPEFLKEDDVLNNIVEAGINRIAAHIQHNDSYRAGDIHGPRPDSEAFANYKGLLIEGMDNYTRERRIPFSLTAQKKAFDFKLQDGKDVLNLKAKYDELGHYKSESTFSTIKDPDLFNKIKDFFSKEDKQQNKKSTKRKI